MDEGELKTARWSNSTDGKANFVSKPIPFIKEIMSGESLVLGTKDYNGTPVVARFNIKRLNTAIADLAAKCNWSVSE